MFQIMAQLREEKISVYEFPSDEVEFKFKSDEVVSEFEFKT